MWPCDFSRCVEVGERYERSRQFADAAVEYEKAASCAPSRTIQTALLERAFWMTERVGESVGVDAHLGVVGGE
jgi:hypothetical protein